RARHHLVSRAPEEQGALALRPFEGKLLELGIGVVLEPVDLSVGPGEISVERYLQIRGDAAHEVLLHNAEFSDVLRTRSRRTSHDYVPSRENRPVPGIPEIERRRS